MAQCKRCGQKVGLFASYCDTCSSLNKQESLQRQAEERERDAEIRRALEEAAKERMRQEELAHQQKIEESIRAVRERVTAGQRAFLHQSLYLSVNSVILGEETAADFDIDMLRQLGLAGWDVVAVVPRTMGIALENKSVDPFGPVSYGGGVGGNVVGVYIIIRKEVTPALDSDEPGVFEFFESVQL